MSNRKEALMDLLTKFETVEVKADTRISEADRIFCVAHQAAYDSARITLPELEFFWNDMLSQQRELLAPTGASSETYLVTYDALKLSDYAIQQQIHSLHPQFISQIVSYFSKTYRFSIDTNGITHNLIPQKPADRWTDNYKELVEKYMKDMDELSLSYTDILEQIFLQTGGRTFSEQALHELKEKCHQAAWITGSGKPLFEQKKSTLQLIGYACSFRDRYSGDVWELADRTKDILRGIAHFETGMFGTAPCSLSRLLGRYDLPDSQHEFPDCEKLQSLRMFKNGRVDIRFASEALAAQFIEDYLKTIC